MFLKYTNKIQCFYNTKKYSVLKSNPYSLSLFLILFQYTYICVALLVFLCQGFYI